MKNLLKIIVGFVVTVIVFIAKAEVSTASSSLLFQPKLPKDN
ncbi:cyclic lactone autoinducer peptide [Aquibacillus koreensis]|uniref:Cyclic lactone autoinducer peptide n=1 Tax=Aquibacillus koreensis TaxID=279446 RepID=A0A9X4AIS1_9BACI|nr:cyclic lactone autoinducer peptide [Aquibacillus koreensis]MCT2534710.1 cyclic lactone autoinducer peptide [Aquibacillus koreensis]MDC3419680.1 cyclic lactone autoinducer peptide [Aquibacillus koreensis]